MANRFWTPVARERANTSSCCASADGIRSTSPPTRRAEIRSRRSRPMAPHIAFRSERSGGGIFVMGATGESVRRVTDFGFAPSWSPDASELVVRPARSSIPSAATSERSCLPSTWALEITGSSTMEMRCSLRGRRTVNAWRFGNG